MYSATFHESKYPKIPNILRLSSWQCGRCLFVGFFFFWFLVSRLFVENFKSLKSHNVHSTVVYKLAMLIDYNWKCIQFECNYLKWTLWDKIIHLHRIKWNKFEECKWSPCITLSHSFALSLYINCALSSIFFILIYFFSLATISIIIEFD